MLQAMVDTTPTRATLISRVIGLMVSPRAEWAKISVEPPDIASLCKSYLLPLIVLPVAAQTIGQLVFGTEVFGATIHPPASSVLITAAATYGLQVLAVFVMAVVVRWIAPAFGVELDPPRAFQLAAYSATAGLLGEVLCVAPQLSGLAPLGTLYGLYLLFLGLQTLSADRSEKILGLAVLASMASLAISLSVALAVTGLGETFRARDLANAPVHVGLPGGTTIDVDHAGDAAKSLQDAARQLKAAEAGPGSGAALAPDALKGLLPDRLDGDYRPGVVATENRALGGMKTVAVSRIYLAKRGRITLSITDMAGAGPLAALAGGFEVRSSRKTATGYQALGRVDGRMTRETFDRGCNCGKYQVLVANRFVVEADGQGVEASRLRAAAAAISFDRLEALAKSG